MAIDTEIVIPAGQEVPGLPDWKNSLKDLPKTPIKVWDLRRTYEEFPDEPNHLAILYYIREGCPNDYAARVDSRFIPVEMQTAMAAGSGRIVIGYELGNRKGFIFESIPS